MGTDIRKCASCFREIHDGRGAGYVAIADCGQSSIMSLAGMSFCKKCAFEINGVLQWIFWAIEDARRNHKIMTDLAEKFLHGIIYKNNLSPSLIETRWISSSRQTVFKFRFCSVCGRKFDIYSHTKNPKNIKRSNINRGRTSIAYVSCDRRACLLRASRAFQNNYYAIKGSFLIGIASSGCRTIDMIGSKAIDLEAAQIAFAIGELLWWTKNYKKHGRRTVDKTKRTSSGLREMLFDEIDALRSGESNPARARALATMASTVLRSVEVEVEFQKYVAAATSKNASGKLGSLNLGAPQISLEAK